MAAGQTSEPNDWKTVEPDDWQNVTTEDSEHERQLVPAKPLSSVIPSPSRIDQFLAPSDMTGNDPNTLRGYLKTWGEALKGGGAGIKAFLTTPLPGTKNNPIIWNPLKQIKKDVSGMEDFAADAKKNPNYAAGEYIAPILLTHTLSKLFTPAGMAAKLTRGTGGAAEDIEPTLSDLRAVTKDVNPDTLKRFGKPSTVGDFVDQVSAAETKLNKEYANALGPHANQPGPITPDGKFPVAEAIYKLKDKLGDTTPQDKAARAYIDKTAALFEKPLTLDELNRQRIAANARLYSFENKSDVAQYSAAGANAGTGVDRAIANTVRDMVYPEMDRLTGKPAGYFRDLQNRVGNLFRLQSDAKEFATAVHQKSMIAKGSTPLERLRPGAAMSARGGVHGFISNIPSLFRAPDPEAEANTAIRSGYGIRQSIQPPPEALSLPVTALLTAIRQSDLKKKLAQNALQKQQ
jgi:hypothetical protein